MRNSMVLCTHIIIIITIIIIIIIITQPLLPSLAHHVFRSLHHTKCAQHNKIKREK